MDTLPVELPTRHPNQTLPGVTRKNQDRFLTLLAETGKHKQVCQAIGIASDTPYQWAVRSESFAKRYEQAKELGEKVLLSEYEDKIDQRAMEGKDDPQSAVLTMFRVKRLDPRYRDNAPTNVNIAGPVSIQLNIGASVQAIQADSKAK